VHVVMIAAANYPLCEPFAGGLESLTWQLVNGLVRRGVQVTTFAGAGSDVRTGARQISVADLSLSVAARADVSMPPELWLREHHAYLQVMLELGRRDDVDVIHNNSLHYLPIALAETANAPMVTTLHTPPTPWLEPAIRLLGDRSKVRFAAVSRHTAASWAHVTDALVVPNGVDVEQWRAGDGGDQLVWFGRIVPEKAPHLAVEIARLAGRRLRMAGPISDPGYFHQRIRPLLDDDAVTYVGHLRQDELARLVGSSAAALVTPDWDEPYGLVAAESLSCGTPVLGFARGGLVEVADDSCGVLVDGGDVVSAAAEVDRVTRMSRSAARQRAVKHCSLDSMLDRYLAVYAQAAVSGPADIPALDGAA